MNNTTAERLVLLNHQFYQTFADQFSKTRMRLQPGVRRILETITPRADILDLGCGNGELARNLARLNRPGSYTGLDFSEGLLAHARQSLSEANQFTFLHSELSQPQGWQDLGLVSPSDSHKPGGLRRYDIVLAFAVLHHIPGSDMRLGVLKQVHALLNPGGQFIHSEWQFLNSQRLQARIIPWEQAGFSAEEVDEGDYLLDWRQGGYGLRYVHHFSMEELALLAGRTGFDATETFFSDGDGGRLGLYQVWKPI